MSAEEPFELTTAVLLRTLADGTCVAQSVVEPRLASLGGEEDALAEQRIFLREYFRRSSPDVLSRFATPKTIELREFGVVLAREDLPHRLACDAPITFACVLLPAGEDTWVSVPVLDHFVFVAKGEDLNAVVTSEIQRIASARDLTPEAFVRLLPPGEHRLETLTIPLEQGARVRGSGASTRKQVSEHARREKAVETLSSAGIALHHLAHDKLAPLVARDTELAALTALLGGNERLGALLVGHEGTGKTALVRAWLAAASARGERKLVYQTSGAQLIAGMSGFGQWQERVKNVMEAAESIDAILYFEDLADLLSERADGGVDLTSAMKRFLQDNKVRFLAEVRADAADDLERKAPALFATLAKIKLEPLDAKRARETLVQRAAHDAKHQPERPQLDAAALAIVVDLAERYLPYGAFPGKAVRLYEDLRDVREGERTHGSGGSLAIDADDVHALFSLQTGVPAFLLRASAPLPIEQIRATLSKGLIGQRDAVERIAETIAVVKAGLQPQGKPLATFLFVGPTGVGKTELARLLAQLLFGSPEAMVRFDMSELMTPDAAERLIRGSERDSGLLTQRVRERPFCVVLLDEIEKAHASVFDLLLQITGEGRLTDARGRTTSFQNAILIMTSNLGATDRRGALGLSLGEATESDDAAHYKKHVDLSFRRELVNRFDRIVVFRHLTRPEIHEVAKLAVAKINARPGLVDRGISLVVSEAALEKLAEDGYSQAYGARALRRHLEERMVSVAARLLGRCADLEGARVRVRRVDEDARCDGSILADEVEPADGLRFQIERNRATTNARDLRGASDVARLRRWVDDAMNRTGVLAVKEQIDALTTQLALAKRGKNERRRSADMAGLLSEHHRLTEVYLRTRAAQDEVRACEELAITTLLGGEPVTTGSAGGPLLTTLLADATASLRRFERALPYVLVALEPDGDAITLCLEELDKGAFERWMPPFLRMIEAARWRAEIHIDRGESRSREVWQEHPRWGPPRSIPYVLDALEEEGRELRNLLLRCTGPSAGALLALEVGLHRHVPADSKDGQPLHVFVHQVASRAKIEGDQWAHPTLNPPSIEGAATRRKGAAARDIDDAQRTIKLVGKKITSVGTLATFYADHASHILKQLLLEEEEDET